jgi:Tfp pilus assembly protein PilF
MKKRLGTTAALALVALALGTVQSALAQGAGQQGSGADTSPALNRATLDGDVLAASGLHVDNRVRIKLSSSNDAGMDLYTDTNGAFRYEGLEPGNYTVEAVDDTNHLGSVRERITLYAGQRLTLKLYLKEEEAAKKDNKGAAANVSDLQNQIPQAARQEYDLAKTLASTGDLVSAVNHFNSAIKIFPAYLDAHNDLGVAYLKLKKIDEATGQFESAIEISPKAFNPRLNLGIILAQRKKYPEALDQLTQAVSNDSSQPAGHLYLGIASLGLDDLDAAKRELTSALDMGGAKFSIAHYYLAHLYMKKGERTLAIGELKSFLTTPSDNSQIADQAAALLKQLEADKN